MATLKNCERCGNVFNAEGLEPLCGDCNIADAKELKKVIDYLNHHPLASIMEVNQKTGVPQQQLQRYVKNGTLKMRKMPEAYKCRLCGNDIKTGTLCEGCRMKVEEMRKKGKKHL